MRQSSCLTAAVVLGALLPTELVGQNVFRAAGTDIRNGVKDVVYVLMAPVRADKQNWLEFGGVMAITLASSLADDDIDSWIVRQDTAGAFDNFEWFREREDPDNIEWSDIGAARWLSKFALGMWGVGLIVGSENLREAGMGCLSTWVSIASTRQVNYWIFSRRRASDANGDQYLLDWGYGEWIDRSWIAGHFANPMGCAKLWTDRFDLGPLEPALYVTTYAIGISRMLDRRHWLSDTIIAGALGYAAGKIVARRQEERRPRHPRTPPVVAPPESPQVVQASMELPPPALIPEIPPPMPIPIPSLPPPG
jgi:hypothetical protein